MSDPGDYPKINCPKCESFEKTKLFDVPNLKFSNPKESSKWDNFGYRAGYLMEKAQGERRVAEEASHMGNTSDFYNHIDDFSNDSNFGEVK